MPNPTKTINPNISWAIDQALPTFAKPAEILDTMHNSTLKPDERVTLAALQGIVNSTQPRILITEHGDSPHDTWIKIFNLKTAELDFAGMIKKYMSEIKGLVMYDTSKSIHYRNIASTVANLNDGYLPMTMEVRSDLSEKGVEFDGINIKSVNWELETPLEIYGKVYDEYWQYCSRRLLQSANPKGDLDHCRDITAAVGAAVVWLDCTKDDERTLYQKFMKDMADYREAYNTTAIVLGWFTTERSGVTAGSTYGISSIPADFYISGSVYSAVSGNTGDVIDIPKIPPKKDVQNKVYIAVFFTDGDNIQYVQRFMVKLWNAEAEYRGKVPANWTIAPGLCDIGPGMLNYFYNLATDCECFVAGPSGMGYLMPKNTNIEPGIEINEFLTERKYMDEYTKLTERYMRRAGLRALTIWDDANADLRDSYEKNCQYIYGATVQDFGAGGVEEGVTNNRLWFAKHETHYEGRPHVIHEHMTKKIEQWQNTDKTAPLFLSYQAQTWQFHTPQLVEVHDKIKAQFGNDVEFVRADHFFALYNEAHNMPFNLCMNEKTTVTSSDDDIIFDFGDTYTITRCDFALELSENGADWKPMTADTPARYAKFRLKCVNCNEAEAYLSDVEIYGYMC